MDETNAYQKRRIDQLKDKGLTIADSLDDQVELLLTGRWSDDFYTHSLKAVFVPYTGKNRFPLNDFEKRKINIFNSHAKASIVAERAFTLALAVLGKIVPYHSALQTGHWTTREKWGKEFWHSLQNKRCGIVGMGHIGKALSGYLAPFHCRIINLSRDQKKNLADEYASSFDELIAMSDIIFIACPLTDQTRHMVNMKNIHLFKDKVIVNIARGEVIEEEALYLGLKEDILLGAGIDVWYQYPKDGTAYPSNYDLSFDHLVMSPHAASHAKEFQHAYYEDIFNQIEQYVEDHYGID
jgi:lactate dehydrogenase-like 2-hydroxyacid dehydrogenase